jgi:hypothetical protein
VNIDTPPRIAFEKGQYWLEVMIGEERHRVALGDGRYFAECVFERIVAPAISPRKTDRNQKSA